jgi:dTDP-4-amino-4,6-dideoxygalactose transaminase
MTKKINVLKPYFRIEECITEIRECLELGWSGMGFKTERMETAWKEYTRLPHAHFLNSNTAGLHLAFHIFKKQFGWANQDEIITTPLTFVSTNHAILYENLKPIFADVDDTLCLDPADVEKKITEKTKAIIFVGVGGNVGQYEAIKTLAKRYHLKLILDAAHMAGTYYHGQHVGHDADVAVFSFQAVKNLPTADAGMICFREVEFDRLARQLSWLGINVDTYTRAVDDNYKWRYEVEQVGFKYHGNSIMAALALVGLKYLDQDNAYRRQLANGYRKALQNIPAIQFIQQVDGCESATHLFQIVVENRQALLNALYAQNIYPGVHYRDNTEYAPYKTDAIFCPQANELSKKLLTLPLHLALTEEDINRVAQAIHKFYTASESPALSEMTLS